MGVFRLLCCVIPILVLAGCSTPVGVREVSPREAYRSELANSLGDGVASSGTKVVLNRYDLSRKFAGDPEATIAALHERALRDNRRDILYALSELCYLHGDRLGKCNVQDYRRLSHDYFLLSAVYAYLFLLDDRPEPPPTAFDERFRTACDLYNFSLGRAMATGEGGSITFPEGVRELPVGRLAVTLERARFPWSLEEFEKFLPADRYEVRGVTVRNRTQGMGLPLVAVRKASKDTPFGSQVLPVTAFLRVRGGPAEITAGTATVSLELHSAYDDVDVIVKNHAVPMETDTTTPLAYKLQDEAIWEFGMKAFLGKAGYSRGGLYLMQPHQPGRIPVVFVHGTFSSPVRWAEMFNTLRADPELRRKYQFWYFLYSSSNPIIISAADLRDAVRDMVAKLDPEGRDPALRQMVVIGHSQGGLLTKLTAVDTGDRLLRVITERDIDSLQASDEVKGLLRRTTLVKPLPFVKRVVFIATPHRGSFLSKSWTRKIIRKLVSLPVNIVKTTLSFHEFFTSDVRKFMGGKVPTSIDGMSPDNPILRTLEETPLAPGVKGHSIIAVKGEGDPKSGNDGVVEYSSAHMDGMESEFIVRDVHSCQGNPAVIEEVRRILLEHLALLPGEQEEKEKSDIYQPHTTGGVNR